MDYVENTHDTADRLKQFWKKFGNLLSTLVLLALIVIIAYNYWHKYQTAQNIKAANLYQSLLQNAKQSKTAELSALATKLQEDYSHSPYSQFALLLQASKAIKSKKGELAMSLLQKIIQQSTDKGLIAVAKTRVARIYISQHHYKKAQDILNSVTLKSFQSLTSMLKGDNAVAQSKRDLALKNYQQALATSQPDSSLNSLIKRKLYSL